MKKVVEKLKEAGKDEDFIKGFQKGVQGYYTKHIVPNFADLDFYTGESMDPDGMYGVSSNLLDYQPRIYIDVASQGRVPQLPRGRCYTICYYLEAWLVRDEGLDAGIRCQNGVCAICPTLLSKLEGFSGHDQMNHLQVLMYECNEDCTVVTHFQYLARICNAIVCRCSMLKICSADLGPWP